MIAAMPRIIRHALILILICLALPGTGFAEVYRWVDGDGKVHYSDQPSQSHTSKTLKIRISTYKEVTVDKSDTDVGKQVVMYSASWCGVCQQAKRYFAEKGIKYTEYDVENSAVGKAEYKKLGATGVPVLLVGDRRMNGFSIEGFEKLYR